MKKTLLLMLISSFSTFQAQVLQSEDFNSLTVGNVGGNLTGTTAGQGGYYSYVATGGVASDFQIVAQGGTNLNVLQITGSSTASNSRYFWKDGLDLAWTSRTAGNNVINLEFDLYTGAATTSKNRQSINIYNAAGDKVLVGFSFVAETKTLLGVCYLNNAGTLGNYSLNLGSTPVVLTANQWVKIGMSFNLTTGEVFWKGPGFYGSFMGAAATENPAEIDYLITSGTSNALAYTAKYDNLNAFAAPAENLLDSEIFVAVPTSYVNVFPNPMSDVLNITSTNFIKSLTIYDINGRIIKNFNDINVIDYTVDVSSLNKGVYFITIYDDLGSTNQKIIKN